MSGPTHTNRRGGTQLASRSPQPTWRTPTANARNPTATRGGSGSVRVISRGSAAKILRVPPIMGHGVARLRRPQTIHWWWLCICAPPLAPPGAIRALADGNLRPLIPHLTYSFYGRGDTSCTAHTIVQHPLRRAARFSLDVATVCHRCLVRGRHRLHISSTRHAHSQRLGTGWGEWRGREVNGHAHEAQVGRGEAVRGGRSPHRSCRVAHHHSGLRPRCHNDRHVHRCRRHQHRQIGGRRSHPRELVVVRRRG